MARLFSVIPKHHLVLALATALLALVQSPADADEDVVPWLHGAKLGMGYDYSTGKLTHIECVNGKVLPEELRKGGAVGDGMKYTDIRTKEDLKKTLQVSASGSARFGVVNASAKANFAHSLTIGQSDATVLVEYRLTYAEKSMMLEAGQPLKKDVSDLTDKQSFRRRCGTHYVSSLLTGGELIAALQTSVRQEKERDDFFASVKASGQTWSAKASVGKATEKKKFASKVNIVGRKAGGATTSTYSLETLESEVRTFREQVLDTVNRKDVVLTAKITPYPVDMPPPVANDLEVEEASAVLNSYDEKLAVLTDVIQRPLLYDIELSTLPKLSPEIARLQDRRKNLYLDITRCIEPGTAGQALSNAACDRLKMYPRVPYETIDKSLPRRLGAMCDEVVIDIAPMSLVGAVLAVGDGKLGDATVAVALTTRLVDGGRKLRTTVVKTVKDPPNASKTAAHIDTQTLEIRDKEIWNGGKCAMVDRGSISEAFVSGPHKDRGGPKVFVMNDNFVDRAVCARKKTLTNPSPFESKWTIDCTLHFHPVRDAKLVQEELLNRSPVGSKTAFDGLTWLTTE